MELKVHYKRQMDRNYMVINGEEGVFQPNYEMRMLEENDIQGFMKLSIRQIDCHLEYRYDISAMQPLSRIYQTRKLGLKEIQTLFFSLKRQLELMAPYLLEGSHLILEPDYIYIQPQTFQIYFCYYTEVVIDFQQALREMIQFILEKLNHEDQEGIVAVYQMYQRSLEESITVESLLKILFTSYEGTQETLQQETEEIEQKEEEKEDVQTSLRNCKEGVYCTTTSIQKSVSSVETLWCTEKKKQRMVILIGSVLSFIALLLFLILSEVWKDEKIFFIFLGMIALGFIYNIWNIQQMRKEEKIGTKITEEKSAGMIVVSYGNNSEREQEMGEDYEQNEGMCKEGIYIENLESKQNEVILPGNTGPLKERNHHALISENPGMWNHIQMSQYPFVIGRIQESCNAVVAFQEISRLHAEIQKKEEELFIMDLNSLNGTYVNGVRLEANTPVKIENGDKICFAQIAYTFY